MRPYYWNNDKVLLIGASGSGKTVTAIEVYLKKADRIMVLDTNMEIATKTGLKSTRNINEWSPECPCYYPKKYNVAHLEKCIQRVRCFNNVQFFLDDLDTYSGGQYYAGAEIVSLMVNARHQNIGTIISNKTPNNIDKRIVQNAHFIHLWNINARYSNVLKDWQQSLGINDEQMDQQFNLETHTFGFYTPMQDDLNATDPKKLEGFFRL